MNPKKRVAKSSYKAGKVYMPVKHSTFKPQRKKKISVFKSAPTTRTTRRNFKLPGYSIFVLLGLVLIAIAFLAVKYINTLRNTEENVELTFVTGLEDLPAYPGSTFIFQNSQDLDSVKNFLSSGSSAYRLPKDTSIEEAFNFYTENLPNYGWAFVQMVSMEVVDKEYGQYWVKDNKGLRIYSKYNDVWYETITVDQANTALAERVQEETEMNLLLTDDEAQDLLPDFPWVLKIPKEYLISYSASAYDPKLQQILFSKIGEDEKVYIVPMDTAGQRAIDYALNDYITLINGQGEERWGIINTYVISTNVGSGLRGIISSNTQDREVGVITNSSNSKVYVIDSNVVDNPFFEYILANIKASDTKKY